MHNELKKLPNVKIMTRAKFDDFILDENGRIFPEVWSARERGVLFDSAQGRIHCSFPVARAAIEQGFPPDVISTDLITFSVYQIGRASCRERV